MKNASVLITQYQQPLLLICYGLLAFALLLKCGERKGRLSNLIFFLILFVMAAVIFLAKDDKAVWIPAAVAMLTVAAPTALSWKPAADKPDGMQQYEEELLRRKAADEALEQMKCQMPDARIEKAQASLRQNDTKAAKETFAEVRRQAGKAAALAAHHEGKLAEGEVNYAEAMELYRTAVLLEKDNPDYLLAAGKLARKLAEYKQAQEWLERLLELREKEGKNDAGLGDALHELALLHKDLGQYAAAEPLYLRAVAVKEQALGKEHPEVAEVLSDLAGLYRREGKYAEAEPLFLRSLAVKEQFFGKEHPSVAETLNNLGVLRSEQGRLAEVESLYLRALEIRAKHLGKNHLDTAESMCNVAVLYRKQWWWVKSVDDKRQLSVIKETDWGYQPVWPTTKTRKIRRGAISSLARLLSEKLFLEACQKVALGT